MYFTTRSKFVFLFVVALGCTGFFLLYSDAVQLNPVPIAGNVPTLDPTGSPVTLLPSGLPIAPTFTTPTATPTSAPRRMPRDPFRQSPDWDQNFFNFRFGRKTTNRHKADAFAYSLHVMTQAEQYLQSLSGVVDSLACSQDRGLGLLDAIRQDEEAMCLPEVQCTAPHGSLVGRARELFDMLSEMGKRN